MTNWVALLLAIFPAAGVVWQFRPRRKTSSDARSPLVLEPALAVPLAKHYPFFAQIRQALAAEDSRYLTEMAPARIAKRAIRERRAVARSFLKGLREDFLNLARLGRTIAALSPSVSHEQETERLILQVRFHALYALVWLRLSTGNLPLHQLQQLTELVEKLATRMEEAMSAVGALSAGRISGNVST